jgi:hypothetical protein
MPRTHAFLPLFFSAEQQQEDTTIVVICGSGFFTLECGIGRRNESGNKNNLSGVDSGVEFLLSAFFVSLARLACLQTCQACLQLVYKHFGNPPLKCVW